MKVLLGREGGPEESRSSRSNESLTVVLDAETGAIGVMGAALAPTVSKTAPKLAKLSLELKFKPRIRRIYTINCQTSTVEMNLMTHPDAIAEVAALLEPVEKALEKSPKSPFAPLSEFRGSKSSNSELDA